jgi:tetratricopeptide (TPR) repeat protein
MSPSRKNEPAAAEVEPEADADADSQAEAEFADSGQAADDIHTVDLVSDELTLARAQLDAGQPALAEGTVRHRIAVREADGTSGDDELDALRALLAESLWRQGRLVAARAALDAVRPSSPQRRLPIVLLIEAESLAAAGEPDRAAGALERVIGAIGVDEAFALRAGVPGRLTWPLPSELTPSPARAARPPWSPAVDEEAATTPAQEDARTAAARVRLEEARVAYVAGDLDRGDAEMSIAVRLEQELAADGVAIMEPTLGGQPSSDRLLLYGDLLRAAGRRVEADRAYDRAAGRRG